MISAADAALASWAFEPGVITGLLAAAILYARGWRRLRILAPRRFPAWRLACFLGGLLTIFVAIASPLDAFANLLLMVHMTQHLLLTMVAPPLVLLGSPFLPLLLGLPRRIRVDAIGPFLTWRPLKRLGAFLVHPVVCWTAFVLSNVAWHTPPLYELALRSSGWHRVEHASFLITSLLFWWPVIEPWPSRMRWPRWTMIPYLLLADIQNTALAAFLSFYERVLYPTYAEAPRISSLSPLGDQAAAGAIMWVPGSIAFLVPAGLIAIQFLSPKRRPAPAPARTASPLLKSPRANKRPPFLVTAGHFMAKRGRRIAQTILLALAALIVWDGFTGPQMGPMNLAGVLPWTHWRGLTVIALLLAGNLFCMACPFMLVRDFGRRFLPASAEWPHALRNKWLPVGLIAVYLWAYEAFSLWDSPWWTAALIFGYFGAAATIDGIFKGASFCKYVCPVGQFHFVQSLASPLEVTVREPEICASCRTHDCIRGNATRRGCELALFQPRKAGNMDCTFCLDCVSACPHDNAALQPVAPGADLWASKPRSSIGPYENRPDLAALVAILTFGAFANAAGMIAPTRRLEESLGLGHATFTTLSLTILLIIFLIILITTALLSRQLSGDPSPLAKITARHAVALAPLGFAMWTAHFLFHLITGLLTPVPLAQRLLGNPQPDWAIRSPAWPGLHGVEILLLDAGLLLTLYALWRIATRPAAAPPRPLAAFLPWAALASVLYAFGVWIIFQPMEMRGMITPG